MGVVPERHKYMVFNHEFFIFRTPVSKQSTQELNYIAAFELVLHILRILLKISQNEYGIKSVK
jgi:hypothetical protein